MQEAPPRRALGRPCAAPPPPRLPRLPRFTAPPPPAHQHTRRTQHTPTQLSQPSSVWRGSAPRTPLGHPRTHSVCCTPRTTLLLVPRASQNAVLAISPGFASSLCCLLCRRVFPSPSLPTLGAGGPALPPLTKALDGARLLALLDTLFSLFFRPRVCVTDVFDTPHHHRALPSPAARTAFFAHSAPPHMLAGRGASSLTPFDPV